MSKALREIIRVVRSHDRLTPTINRGMATGEPWWVDPHDEVLQSKLARAMMRGDADRSGSLHPSSLHTCQRRQVFEYHGVPPIPSWDPQLRTIFADGHWRHMRWQVILWNLGLISDFEVPVAVPELRISGSADGVMTDEYLVEIKGTSQIDAVKTDGVMSAHRTQVQTYLMLSGLDEAIVLYESKSNSALEEFTVRRDENVIAGITALLEELNEHLEKETLPDVQDECRFRTGDFDRCPYRHVCLHAASPSEAVAAGLAAVDAAEGGPS